MATKAQIIKLFDQYGVEPFESRNYAGMHGHLGNWGIAWREDCGTVTFLNRNSPDIFTCFKTEVISEIERGFEIAKNNQELKSWELKQMVLNKKTPN